MAIVTYPLNGIDFSAEDAETYLCTRTSGVYSSDSHFAATITGAREITIGEGLAWINNDDFAGKSVCVNAPVAVSLEIANSGLPRIDRIVLRFDKAQNSSSIAVKTGTPNANPVAPEITRTSLIYELGLYTVSVPAASLEVTTADITSTILDETVCGIMRDGVTGIPTEALIAQATAKFEAAYLELAALKDQLTGNQAVNLNIRIDDMLRRVVIAPELPPNIENGVLYAIYS